MMGDLPKPIHQFTPAVPCFDSDMRVIISGVAIKYGRVARRERAFLMMSKSIREQLPFKPTNLHAELSLLQERQRLL